MFRYQVNSVAIKRLDDKPCVSQVTLLNTVVSVYFRSVAMKLPWAALLWLTSVLVRKSSAELSLVV